MSRATPPASPRPAAAPPGTPPPGALPPDPTDEAPLTPDPAVVALLETARPRRGRQLAVAVGLLAAGGLVAALLWPRAVPRYQTAAVTAGDLVRTVTAVGTLAPVDEVEISSELSGRVAAVEVEVNQRVTVGQPLARLDERPFRHAATQAKAQLRSAQATQAQAVASRTAAAQDLDRARRLRDRGAGTDESLEDAQAAHDRAVADVEAAAAQVALRRAALADAEDDLERTVIVSPIDGVVLVRAVEPGQTVVSTMSATALFTVASDLGALKAEVGVDEADVGQVAAGMPARFTVSAWPERDFSGAIHTVDLAPQDDADVVTYAAELRLENPDLALRPGMTATAAIEVGRLEDVLLVPTRALRWSPPRETGGFGPPGPPPSTPAADTSTLWTLDPGGPPGSIAERPVTVLGTNGTQTAVASASASPLNADDQVIVGTLSEEES